MGDPSPLPWFWCLLLPGWVTSCPPALMLVLLTQTVAGLACIHYLYHRRPSTGFIGGDESTSLIATSENRPTIHSFTLVKGLISPDDIMDKMVQAGIPHRRFKRFSYCITSDYRTRSPFDLDKDWPAYFYPDPNFDLRKHVRYLEGGPKDHDSMLAYLSTIVNDPPPFDRSPWEILVCPHFADRDQTAIIIRVHHVLADGLALVTFMDAITEPDLASGADPDSSSLSAAAKVGTKMMIARGVGQWALMWLRMALEFPLVMFRDYILPRPDQNVFKQQLSGKKRLGWSLNRVAMTQVKNVKEKLGVKINDLFLSCATAALRNLAARSAGSKSEIPHEVKLYTPISVRTSVEHCEELNNKISVLVVPLPTRIDDKIERVKHIERMMNSKKGSIVPWGLSHVMKANGILPRAVLQTQLSFLYNKVTAVLTNVPGPAHKRQFAGKIIEEVMFWVPGVGPIGVVLSLFSYGDQLSMGVVVDESLPFAPEDFIHEFFHEFMEYDDLAHKTPY